MWCDLESNDAAPNPHCRAGAVVLGAVLPAAGAPEARVFRVGLLNALQPKTPLEEEVQQAFCDELRSRGWVDGTNLQLIRRYTQERPGATAELTAELLAAKADVIVVFGEGPAAAVRRITTTTPIVFTHGVAPSSLDWSPRSPEPGGNVTGVANQATTLSDQADRTGALDAARYQASGGDLVSRFAGLLDGVQAAEGRG